MVNHSCAACSAEHATARCKGCMGIYYCSAECQRYDWKNKHSLVCDMVRSICHEETWRSNPTRASIGEAFIAGKNGSGSQGDDDTAVTEAERERLEVIAAAEDGASTRAIAMRQGMYMQAFDYARRLTAPVSPIRLMNFVAHEQQETQADDVRAKRRPFILLETWNQLTRRAEALTVDDDSEDAPEAGSRSYEATESASRVLCELEENILATLRFLGRLLTFQYVPTLWQRYGGNVAFASMTGLFRYCTRWTSTAARAVVRLAVWATKQLASVLQPLASMLLSGLGAASRFACDYVAFVSKQASSGLSARAEKVQRQAHQTIVYAGALFQYMPALVARFGSDIRGIALDSVKEMIKGLRETLAAIPPDSWTSRYVLNLARQDWVSDLFSALGSVVSTSVSTVTAGKMATLYALIIDLFDALLDSLGAPSGLVRTTVVVGLTGTFASRAFYGFVMRHMLSYLDTEGKGFVDDVATARGLDPAVVAAGLSDMAAAGGGGGASNVDAKQAQRVSTYATSHPSAVLEVHQMTLGWLQKNGFAVDAKQLEDAYARYQNALPQIGSDLPPGSSEDTLPRAAKAFADLRLNIGPRLWALSGHYVAIRDADSDAGTEAAILAMQRDRDTQQLIEHMLGMSLEQFATETVLIRIAYNEQLESGISRMVSALLVDDGSGASDPTRVASPYTMNSNHSSQIGQSHGHHHPKRHGHLVGGRHGDSDEDDDDDNTKGKGRYNASTRRTEQLNELYKKRSTLSPQDQAKLDKAFIVQQLVDGLLLTAKGLEVPAPELPPNDLSPEENERLALTLKQQVLNELIIAIRNNTDKLSDQLEKTPAELFGFIGFLSRQLSDVKRELTTLETEATTAADAQLVTPTTRGATAGPKNGNTRAYEIVRAIRFVYRVLAGSLLLGSAAYFIYTQPQSENLQTAHNGISNAGDLDNVDRNVMRATAFREETGVYTMGAHTATFQANTDPMNALVTKSVGKNNTLVMEDILGKFTSDVMRGNVTDDEIIRVANMWMGTSLNATENIYTFYDPVDPVTQAETWQWGMSGGFLLATGMTTLAVTSVTVTSTFLALPLVIVGGAVTATGIYMTDTYRDRVQTFEQTYTPEFITTNGYSAVLPFDATGTINTTLSTSTAMAVVRTANNQLLVNYFGVLSDAVLGALRRGRFDDFWDRTLPLVYAAPFVTAASPTGTAQLSILKTVVQTARYLKKELSSAFVPGETATLSDAMSSGTSSILRLFTRQANKSVGIFLTYMAGDLILTGMMGMLSRDGTYAGAILNTLRNAVATSAIVIVPVAYLTASPEVMIVGAIVSLVGVDWAMQTTATAVRLMRGTRPSPDALTLPQTMPRPSSSTPTASAPALNYPVKSRNMILPPPPRIVRSTQRSLLRIKNSAPTVEEVTDNTKDDDDDKGKGKASRSRQRKVTLGGRTRALVTAERQVAGSTIAARTTARRRRAANDD